jgi:hypothetical protein
MRFVFVPLAVLVGSLSLVAALSASIDPNTDFTSQSVNTDGYSWVGFLAKGNNAPERVDQRVHAGESRAGVLGNVRRLPVRPDSGLDR